MTKAVYKPVVQYQTAQIDNLTDLDLLNQRTATCASLDLSGRMRSRDQKVGRGVVSRVSIRLHLEPRLVFRLSVPLDVRDA